MSSTNTFSRPPGYISIPVEIVPRENSSSYRTFRNDNSYSDYSNSPPWKKPSINRFQPRQNTTTAYDRLINNSPVNQPLKNRHYQQRLYEPSPLHFSRSSDDLLSSPTDSTRSNIQSQNTSHHPPTFTSNYHYQSDFLQPPKHTDSLRRSYDTLNDYSDTYQKFPTNRQHSTFVHRNEYRDPVNHPKPNIFQESSHDRSRSPASQRGESPTRPPPPPQSSSSQQQQESDFKVTKDATNSIPISGQQTACSTSQSNDQQVPSRDSPLPTNIPPIPIRDPNTIALEKLEQIRQNLIDLNQQVDAFTGSTRNERIYKELDEQALKMMMRCDELLDVSTDIKEKRKEMIRNVQTVLAKLESKVPINSSMETALVLYDPEQDKSSNTPTEEQTT